MSKKTEKEFQNLEGLKEEQAPEVEEVNDVVGEEIEEEEGQEEAPKYVSKTQQLLDNPTVKFDDLSDEAKDMVNSLRAVTDGFTDWSDEQIRNYDELTNKYIRHELKGKKVTPTMEKRIDELETKIAEDNAEMKKKKEEEEKNKPKPKKEKKVKRSERDIMTEKYIDGIFERGKRSIPFEKMSDLGWKEYNDDTFPETIQVGKYMLYRELYFYGYEIVLIKEEEPEGKDDKKEKDKSDNKKNKEKEKSNED